MNTFLAVSAGEIGEIFAGFFSSVGSSFANFSWFDALDILLLTGIFFFLLRFLKGRKAGALLLGIGICLILYFVSYVFGLSGTNYIFSGLFRYGALALIILFQPEIRDALERMGSGSINGIMSIGEQKQKKQLYLKAIDNICNAVTDLSKTQTGALIVIERTTKLDDVVATGITINADVNSFLLRNLFFNKAPLHDGAVIIAEGRIVAAGCLLPLTRRTDVDSDLGTRHRAAIGMSETSDALIVVVSEETGIVSVAEDATLTRNFTQDSLRRYLIKKLLRGRHGEQEL